MGSFREEFNKTKRTLARHPAAIRERFIDALIAGVAHLSANQHELDKMPAEVKESFVEFMDKVTADGGSMVPGEGAIQGTLGCLSEGDVQILVDEFLGIAYQIEQIPR